MTDIRAALGRRRRSFTYGRRRRSLVLGLFVLLLIAGCGGGADQPQVWVIGLDGADWDILDPMIERGELPNLARLREEGAYGRLRSDEPLLSPMIWTSIATGRTVDEHGITWFMTDGPDGEKIPISSRNRNVRALWNIATERDRSSAVIGWWATWPVEPIDGFMVSDYVGWHSFGVTGQQIDAPGKVWPSDMQTEILDMLPSPDDVDDDLLQTMVDLPADKLGFDPERGPLGGPLPHLRQAVATARGYTDIALDLLGRRRTDFFAVYYEGTDATMHLFGNYSPPQQPWVSDEDYAAFRNAVAGYWQYQDRLLGELLARARAEHHGHGHQRPRLPHRRGATARGALRDRARRRLAHDRRRDRSQRAGRAAGHAILRPPTSTTSLPPPAPHGSPRRARHGRRRPRVGRLHRGVPGRQSGRADRDLRDRYLGPRRRHRDRRRGGREHGGDAALAGLHQRWRRGDDEEWRRRHRCQRGRHERRARGEPGQRSPGQGRLQEAAATLEEQVEKHPDHFEARLNLAQVYGEMGNFERGLPLFEELWRENPENLDVIEDYALGLARAGQLQKAIELYEAGLEIDEDWATGLAGLGFARHQTGRSDEGLRELERAVELDPRLALGHYYLAQVQRDRGNLAAARDQLERTLALDPTHEQAALQIARMMQSRGQGAQARRFLEDFLEKAGASRVR